MRHVRDMHLQLVTAVGMLSNVHRVVEIACRLAINRDDWQRTKIASAMKRLLGHLLRRSFGFSDGILGKNVRQVMLANHYFDIYTDFARPSENFDHASYRRQTTLGIPSDLRDRKSTRLNSSHMSISYAVFCLKKKKHECTLSRSIHTLRPDSNST